MAELIAKAAGASELQSKIARRTARVGILGLGYVGLPLGLTFAEKGFRIRGFDVDPKKKAALERMERDIKQVIARTVRVDVARAAEAAKLVENIFRAVNIALVNELEIVFDRMGIFLSRRLVPALGFVTADFLEYPISRPTV